MGRGVKERFWKFPRHRLHPLYKFPRKQSPASSANLRIKCFIYKQSEGIQHQLLRLATSAKSTWLGAVFSCPVGMDCAKITMMKEGSANQESWLIWTACINDRENKQGIVFLSLSLKQRKGKLVMWPARFNYRRFSVSVPSQTTHWLIYNWDHSITLRYNYRPSASSKLDYEDSHLQVKFFSISIP